MSEVGFYANICKVDPLSFLELLYTNPDKAESMITEALGAGVKDIFDDEHDMEPEVE